MSRKVNTVLGVCVAAVIGVGGLAYALHGPFLALYRSAVQAQVELAQGTLNVGPHQVRVDIAATEPARARGLMDRTELGRVDGMLFVFDAPERQCMWMKNTKLALSVAFIDAGGRVINVEDMLPGTESPHCSTPGSRPLYALEMATGWFRDRQLGAGTVVLNLPSAAHDSVPTALKGRDHAND